MDEFMLIFRHEDGNKCLSGTDPGVDETNHGLDWQYCSSEQICEGNGLFLRMPAWLWQKHESGDKRTFWRHQGNHRRLYHGKQIRLKRQLNLRVHRFCKAKQQR
jgi:hypothetical protein